MTDRATRTTVFTVMALIGALAALTTPAHAQDGAPACRAPLFATGFDKTPAAGSKAALIAAVEQGEAIRVGWRLDFDEDGAADLTHWAAAAFVTVWEGEVFAQVDAIHIQRPQRAADGAPARIDLPPGFGAWRGLLSTTGVLTGAFSDGDSFPDDLRVAVTWCAATPAASPWTVVYKHGPDGAPLLGSKAALFAAIRAGQPIQIGWGASIERENGVFAVEHVVAPVFVSIIGEAHVGAQLPEHIAQRGYGDVGQALFDDPAVMWRGLMTTEGTFDAVWVDRGSGEVVRRWPQRAALTWYAHAAAPATTPSLAVPGGVTRDQARAAEVIPPVP